jgi:hypothetical protein
LRFVTILLGKLFGGNRLAMANSTKHQSIYSTKGFFLHAKGKPAVLYRFTKPSGRRIPWPCRLGRGCIKKSIEKAGVKTR